MSTSNPSRPTSSDCIQEFHHILEANKVLADGFPTRDSKKWWKEHDYEDSSLESDSEGEEKHTTMSDLNKFLLRELNRVLDRVSQPQPTSSERARLSGVHWGIGEDETPYFDTKKLRTQCQHLIDYDFENLRSSIMCNDFITFYKLVSHDRESASENTSLLGLAILDICLATYMNTPLAVSCMSLWLADAKRYVGMEREACGRVKNPDLLVLFVRTLETEIALLEEHIRIGEKKNRKRDTLDVRRRVKSVVEGILTLLDKEEASSIGMGGSSGHNPNDGPDGSTTNPRYMTGAASGWEGSTSGQTIHEPDFNQIPYDNVYERQEE